MARQAGADRAVQGAGPASRTAARRRAHQVLLGGGHLAVLWAIAVAQPLFDLLGRNPEFFAVRGSTPREIVLFAVALTLVPPAVLTAVEALAELVSARLRAGLHIAFVGVLLALITLQAGKRALEEPGVALVIAAALAGVAGALAYRFVGAIRFAATLFLPVPLILMLLFLLASPVSQLVNVEEAAEGRAAAVEAAIPVVLVVFDELPTTSLLDRRARIDRGRFPGFGALAADATWFRSATTVSPATEDAVPAILTGRFPREGELPLLADHPDNLFTFLRDDYELRVTESLTHLCPPESCRPAREDAETLSTRARSLGADLGVVYLHLVVPDRLATGLPPVGDTWSGFLGATEEDEDDEQAPRGERPLQTCGRNVCAFVDRIRPTARPAFYFFHSVLPHAPWLFLPSGRRYIHDIRLIPGTEGPNWGDDEWLIQQGYQRHLLQAGYADRALGLILERLRRSGVYDDALVIVTADHGHAFLPGQPRRLVTPENLHGLAFVPLFVKLPGQREGRVVDGFARTIDVVPTIADVLDVELTWDVDGTSLLGRRLASNADVVLARLGGGTISARLSELRARQDEALKQQLEWFGQGDWEGVYRIGPNRALVGESVARLPVVQSPTGVELTGASVFRAVDPGSGSIPSYVTGVVAGGSGGPTDLAIALNGRVAAVTRTEADGTRFAALVPDDALVPGANDVHVYAVRPGPPVTLEELEGLELAFTLHADERRIEVAGGRPIRIVDGPLEGEVRARLGADIASLRGWAADREAGRPAERVLVFVGEEAVFTGHVGNADRRRWEMRLGIPEAGFLAELPVGLLPPRDGGPPVRVFAVAGGVAAELEYRPPFPWPRPAGRR